jgi:anti-anti-sigma factor
VFAIRRDPAQLGILGISIHASEGRHVIALKGELDLASAPALTSALETVMPEASAVVLDLDRLSFIDSSGIVAVLACQSECRQHDVTFALTDGSPQVRRLLEIAGLTSELPFVRQGGLAARRSSGRGRRLEASIAGEARRLRNGWRGHTQAS